jgi:hypothetical protein
MLGDGAREAGRKRANRHVARSCHFLEGRFYAAAEEGCDVIDGGTALESFFWAMTLRGETAGCGVARVTATVVRHVQVDREVL